MPEGKGTTGKQVWRETGAQVLALCPRSPPTTSCSSSHGPGEGPAPWGADTPNLTANAGWTHGDQGSSLCDPLPTMAGLSPASSSHWKFLIRKQNLK